MVTHNDPHKFSASVLFLERVKLGTYGKQWTKNQHHQIITTFIEDFVESHIIMPYFNFFSAFLHVTLSTITI